MFDIKKILRLLSILSVGIMLPHGVYALDTYTTQNILNQTIQNSEFLNTADQSYCIQTPTQSFGLNENLITVPASVSKLYVTDMALTKLGKDYRFITNVNYKNNTLYIKGSSNPFFVTEYLTDILSQIQKDNKNVFISKIVYTPDFYFNWSTDSTATKKELIKYITKNKNTVFASSVSVISGEYQEDGGVLYQDTSESLLTYLKQMNMFSTNSVADILFTMLGGKDAFALYMKETYGLDQKTVSFSTGSGLDGNTTTCNATILILKRLYEYSVKNNIPLTDFLSVPPQDRGSMAKRFSGLGLENKFVAKDGFLYNHNTIAGIYMTPSGPVYFGFFLTYPNLLDYKKGMATVDKLVSNLISQDVTMPFHYTPVGALAYGKGSKLVVRPKTQVLGVSKTKIPAKKVVKK